MIDAILLFSAVLLFLALVMYLDVRTSGGPASLQLEAMVHDMVPPPPETKNKTTMNINIDKFNPNEVWKLCNSDRWLDETPFPNEEFRTINGYPGYKISNYGRVFSTPRYWVRGGMCRLTDRQGYWRIQLRGDDGRRKSLNVHRLVALAFLENENSLPCINHKDENRKNNFVGNLEWCTYNYNNNYGNRLQKVKETKISNGTGSKTTLQYDMNTGELIKVFDSVSEAANSLGLTKTCILLCCEGKGQTAGGYLWRYAKDGKIKKHINVKRHFRHIYYRVNKYSLEGELIAAYKKVSEAARENHVSYNKMVNHLNGYTKKLEGYIYRYEYDSKH